MRYSQRLFSLISCEISWVHDFSIFGMGENEVVKDPFIFSFQEHTLRVTDIVSGYGLCNSIIISSSEDRTCKVLHFCSREE